MINSHHPKRIFKIMASLTLSTSLLSCGKEKASSTDLIEVLKRNDSNGSYFLDQVKLESVSSIDSMNGSYLEILGNATINALATEDELIRPDDDTAIFLKKGERVKTDYVIESGVVHARNFDTLAMFTLYYNFETIKKTWEEKLGLNFSEIGKIKLYYSPRIGIQAASSTSVSVTEKLNAAFIPGPKDFLFFKVSPIEKIPISMNLGVFAHEFGHLVFDHYFASADPKAYDGSTSSEYTLDGMNEGLADFFSYAVTNNTTIYGDTLDVLANQRNLPVSWTMGTLNELVCKGEFYCQGSVLASSLYEITQTTNTSSIDLSKIVTEALTGLRSDYDKFGDSSSFEYHYLINRILTLLPAAKKSQSCTIFKKWFDRNLDKENISC